MTRKQKRFLRRIIVSVVLYIGAVLADRLLPENAPVYASLLLYLIPYLTVGWDVLWSACRNIAHGQIFDEHFLMCIATVGALSIGFLPSAEPEFQEAVFVMLFFQIGELFESIAVGKSRRSIASLMDIRPDSACVERNGEVLTVDPAEVAVGETILVKPGEKIPLDGVVTEGSAAINTVALTGESAPRTVTAGDSVISGCIDTDGVLRVRVSKNFGDSTVSKILDLVENSAASKSKSEHFITRFSRYYTPSVVIAALLLAFVPPLLSGDFTGQFASWLLRSMTFLVISCPCALVISVPLSFFGGIGGASRKGILIKGSNYMETLAKTEIVAFDKTGTLTRGNFAVTAVHPEGVAPAELLDMTAHTEAYSGHPIARSIRKAYGREVDPGRVSNVEEIAGRGIRATLDGSRTVCAGNEKLMEQTGARCHPCELPGTVIHVSDGGVYTGHIVIADEVKPSAAEAIAALKQNGVRRTVMLTGDREDVGRAVACSLGIDEYHAGLLPADKVTYVEQLLREKSCGGRLAFVGDGINDAPVLSRADVGIAMGALGSDAAIEAADVVLMDDDPLKIAEAIRISRRTLGIVRQNIVFALAVKALILLLLASGILGGAAMWLAVFADVGVTVIAVLNAMRALR